MEAIKHAISPEQLALARKTIFADERDDPELRAARLDERLRRKAEAKAEADDRNRHERRKAAALGRHERV